MILFSLEKCEAKLMTEFHIRREQTADFKNAVFKKVQNSGVKQKGKNCTEKLFFRKKNRFGDKKLWAVIDARVMQLFEISAKFSFF